MRDHEPEATDLREAQAIADDEVADFMRGRYPRYGDADCPHQEYADELLLLGDELVPACAGCGTARTYLPPPDSRYAGDGPIIA